MKGVALADSCIAQTLPRAQRWQYEPFRFFGSWQQTETLIVLSLAEELDATQICDALYHDQPGYQVVLHLLRKLCHQGVLLHRQIGKLIVYRLNPQFSAASELRSFLRVLGRIFPQYRSGVDSLAHSGTQRGRTLRQSTKAMVAFPPAIDPNAAAQ